MPVLHSPQLRERVQWRQELPVQAAVHYHFASLPTGLPAFEFAAESGRARGFAAVAGPQWVQALPYCKQRWPAVYGCGWNAPAASSASSGLQTESMVFIQNNFLKVIGTLNSFSRFSLQFALTKGIKANLDKSHISLKLNDLDSGGIFNNSFSLPVNSSFLIRDCKSICSFVLVFIVAILLFVVLYLPVCAASNSNV